MGEANVGVLDVSTKHPWRDHAPGARAGDL